MPYARLEELNQLVQRVQLGAVRARPSLQGLVPQRRIEAGDIDLRMPLFGIQGLLVPYPTGGLGTVLLAFAVGVLGSWLYSIPILVAGAFLVALAYRRM